MIFIYFIIRLFIKIPSISNYFCFFFIYWSNIISFIKIKYLQPVNRESLTLQVLDYLKIDNGDVYPSISPFLLDGRRVRGRHTDAGFNFGFGFGGFRLFGRDFFDFDIKGRFEFESVSGTLTRAVQYKKGINKAYELLTENVKFDNSLNKIIYPFDRKGFKFRVVTTCSRITSSAKKL